MKKTARETSRSPKAAPPAKEVLILDDDEEVAAAVKSLMRSVGLPCRVYHDPGAFLADRAAIARCGCLILDLRMPVFSGLEVQSRLKRMGNDVPVIFLSGHGDIPTALRAIRAGALDFLEKPFRDQTLLDLVNRALRSGSLQPSTPSVALTPRERDAAEGILRSETSAVTADRLGISRRTVDVYRSRLLRRLNVARASEARPILKELLAAEGSPAREKPVTRKPRQKAR